MSPTLVETRLVVDGVPYVARHAPHTLLATMLRDELGLRQVHVSCAEGECGACTILLDGQPVTSCLVLAASADGGDVQTVAGLAPAGELHPVQQAFIDEQAFQCAFCTPGFVISAVAFLRDNPNPTPDEAAEGVSGNICRCGAHPYIVQAVLTAAEQLRGDGPAAARPPHGVIASTAD